MLSYTRSFPFNITWHDNLSIQICYNYLSFHMRPKQLIFFPIIYKNVAGWTEDLVWFSFPFIWYFYPTILFVGILCFTFYSSAATISGDSICKLCCDCILLSYHYHFPWEKNSSIHVCVIFISIKRAYIKMLVTLYWEGRLFFL